MSKGNKVVMVRMSEHMLNVMAEAIEAINLRTRDEPIDRSVFIRRAIREKLDHMKRSRKPRRPASAIEQPTASTEVQ